MVSSTNSKRIELLDRQLAIRQVNTSNKNATHSHPCQVDTSVKFATNRWFSRPAWHCRFIKS